MADLLDDWATSSYPQPTSNQITITVSKTAKEQNFAKALTGLADRTYPNINQAYLATGTPRRTLDRRLKDGRTRREVNVGRQGLSTEEERALVKWVEQLSCTGNPVHHSFLRDLASEIRKLRFELEGLLFTPAGNHWVSRFLARNQSLQSKLAKSIEVARKEVTET